MNQSVIRKLVSLGLLLVFTLVFAFTTDYFFTWNNICSLLREVSVIGLMSIGGAFVIIGGGIDLSTGAVMGLAAMAASRLVTDTLIPIWLIVLVCLLIGTAAGLFNGILVTVYGLSEFIATFASSFVFRGIIYMAAYREEGRIVTKQVTDAAFLSVGEDIGGLYYMSVVWLLLVLAAWFVLKQTKLGTYIYASGSSARAAEYTGINVDKIKTVTFVISGLCSALAGVFLLAWQGSAGLNTGNGMEFQAIAAAVVGGIALGGGRGDAAGVAIGSFFMVMIVNGLYKYGLPTEMQTIFYGVIIIVMAVFDALYLKAVSKRHIVDKKSVGKGGAA